MALWGKLIGSVAGLALGGPLGALLGGAAGHVVDRLQDQARGNGAPRPGSADSQVAFTVAVVALAAKMAKVDGAVSRDEIAAFKRLFHIPPGEMAGIGRLFDEAKQSAEGFEPYARQIASMFRDHPQVLENLLTALFEIARADGRLHPAELDYLQRVATIFGFSPERFRRAQAGTSQPSESDPYEVLGVTRKESTQAIKAAHRKLLRENHPDIVMAQGLPPEMIEVANRKMAAINAAWDAIRKERGLE